MINPDFQKYTELGRQRKKPTAYLILTRDLWQLGLLLTFICFMFFFTGFMAAKTTTAPATIEIQQIPETLLDIYADAWPEYILANSRRDSAGRRYLLEEPYEITDIFIDQLRGDLYGRKRE